MTTDREESALHKLRTILLIRIAANVRDMTAQKKTGNRYRIALSIGNTLNVSVMRVTCHVISGMQRSNVFT
jgi:hypothetical protein